MVNGKHITHYVADSFYVMDGVKVVEDVKPKNFIDDLSKIKIELFKSIYEPEYEFRFCKKEGI
jgi:hypothetical protein